MKLKEDHIILLKKKIFRTTFFFISGIVFLLLVYTGILKQVGALNSDSLVSYFMAQDILRGAWVNGWTIGTHNYLFPDVLFMVGLKSLGLNYLFSHLFFFIFSFAALLFSLHKTFKKLELIPEVTLYYILFIATLLNSWFGSFLLPPGTHAIVLIITLLVPSIIESKQFRYFCILLIPIAFSDLLSLTYFLIPLSIIFLKRKKWAYLLLTVALVFGSYLLIKTINQWIGFKLVENPRGDVVDSIRRFFALNWEVFFLKKPYEGYLIVAGHIYLIKKIIHERTDKKYDFYLFCFFSSWGTFFSTLVLGYYIDESSVRYFLPFIYFGHIFFLLLITEMRKTRYLAIIFIVILIVQGIKTIGRSKEYFNFSIPLQERVNISKHCFNEVYREENLSKGMVTYWYYKKYFVDLDLTKFSQINSQLETDEVLINTNNHLPLANFDISDGNFIISNGVDKNQLNNWLAGKHYKKITKCPGIEIVRLM